jgi:hypothetical protein
MIRKSHLLLALALVAAAVAAPIAQSSSAPKVDPLAVSYLMGQGYTPSQVHAWTVGACSHETKPAACFGPSKGANLGGAAKIDPLAVSYLMGQGLTPDQVQSWTAGACSQQTKAASCYAVFDRGATSPKVDPLAVSYLMGQGLTPDEVKSWTAGACSQQNRAASCYAMFKPAATVSTQVARSTGFQWDDAGIGAGFTLGIMLLIGGAGAGLLISRQNRRHHTARA